MINSEDMAELLRNKLSKEEFFELFLLLDNEADELYDAIGALAEDDNLEEFKAPGDKELTSLNDEDDGLDLND